MESMSATVESSTATAATSPATPSLSSLVPSSDVHTSVSASTPHSAHVQQHAAGSKGGNNSTLSLIGSANAARVRLTKDLRSLVRSNSTSASTRNDRRFGRQHQRTASVQVQVGVSDARGRNLSPHALLPGSAVTYNLHTMEKPREESRSGRSFGARLVNFLSRSRSRSRSKKRRSRSMDDVVVPVSEMPTKQLQASSLGRKNPFNTLLDSTNTSNSTSTSSGSASKPATRSPSRPLSGATTVTDTTVKGLFQKSPRAREKSPEVPLAQPIHVQAEVLGTRVAESQGKTKRTNIFSVSISTPRKHSSRDSSVSALATASPTPPEHSNRRPWSPFRSGSGSSAGGHSTRSTVGGGGGGGGDPSMSRETPPPPVPPKPSTSTSTATSTPNTTPASSAGKGKATRPRVVAPVQRPVREDTITTLNSPPPPYQYQYEYEGREVDEVSLAGRCSPLCGLTPPRLTPNSDKGKEREREKERQKEREKERERERSREKGKEREHVPVLAPVQERERERQRVVVKSPTPKPREEAEKRKGKDREREITNPRRVGSPIVRERERMSRIAAHAAPGPVQKTESGGSGHSKRSKESITHVVKTKRTKHGSFDFERPVSGANGATNMRTALQVLGVGPSMHGDGRRPLERNVSTKERPPRSQPPSHSHHQQSQSTASPSSNNHSRSASTRRPTVDISSPPPPQHHRRDGSHGNANANATSPGRSHPTATNQTDFVPATPHSSQSGQSSSLGRTAGARMLRGPHPAFPFEPAVPTIPTIPDERTHHVNRTPSPSKTHRPQESSATKGRSVDLGLSLSWAPQRVREEAVLSYNQSAGGGSPATASRVRTRWRGGGDVDEEGRLNGPGTRTPSSVAEEFKEALGDAAYGTFKTYVHRFDAGAIPLQGPYGLIAAASRLLDTAGTLDERHKRALLDRFIRFVQENQ